MAKTNRVTFQNQNKTGVTTSTSASWVSHGNAIDASLLEADHEYFTLSWYNCFSPGSNEGATKLAFSGFGGDLPGSVHQRHNTNNSGQYIGHMGTFTCPNPAEPIEIYRQRVAGASPERTEYGQFFCIDLTPEWPSLTGLVSGQDFYQSGIDSSRSISDGSDVQDSTVVIRSGAALVAATVKIHDAIPGASLVGLYVEDVLKVSGSRYSPDTSDINQVFLVGAFDVKSGDSVKIKNIAGHTINTSYSYTFVLNLEAAGSANTGYLANWTDYSSSGTWGSGTLDGKGPNFVFARGRQLDTGAESGRPASISIKNNTKNEWMVLPHRPSGDFNPIYFPNTNYGVDAGQLETAVVVGTGIVGSGNSLEMFTI